MEEPLRNQDSQLAVTTQHVLQQVTVGVPYQSPSVVSSSFLLSHCTKEAA